MGMQQGSAICRYFAKSGGCKSGDTCRFFHEPALAVTVTPGGIEFAARRRGDPAVSMQLVRSVGATRAMVDCTRAPSSWPSMTALQSLTAEWERAASVLERAGAVATAELPPRYDGVHC
jgi:hypothetical protein